MSSHVVYYFAAFALILTHSTIASVKGQCTVQGCENEESSVSIVAEIQQLRVELLDQLNKQVQSITELNGSFQEMKRSQHDTVMKSHNDTVMRSQLDAIIRSLQAVDRRRSQEHDIYIKQGQSIHELLNASYQEMKSQHETVNTSLQAIYRCSKEHDIYIKQGQSIHDILNKSFQEIISHHDTVEKSLQAVDQRRSQEHNICIRQGQSIHELLNESFQEIESQHGAIRTSLQAVDRRLQEHDITIRTRTQNLWKLANGICNASSQICDCSDLKASGLTASGVYEVCVRQQLDQFCTNAFCDMETANGASLVFQRRKDGSVNFNRTWAEYKQGFGNPNGEFWLGNEMLYLLTSKRNYKLRVDLEDFHGNKSFAEYARFSISSSANNYRLTVGGYSGTAGDSLNHNNGTRFSSIDVDNDDCTTSNSYCVRKYGGAWWYGCCTHSTLNGKYYHRYDSVSNEKGIHWYHWHNGFHNSLKSTEMKLVPVA